MNTATRKSEYDVITDPIRNFKFTSDKSPGAEAPDSDRVTFPTDDRRPMPADSPPRMMRCG